MSTEHDVQERSRFAEWVNALPSKFLCPSDQSSGAHPAAPMGSLVLDYLVSDEVTLLPR